MAWLEKDLAYLAGIIDTRFTCSFNAESKRPKLTLRAALTGRDGLVDWMQKWIGSGTVSVVRRETERRPCTHHCKTAHLHIASSTSLQFQLQGMRAAVVLHNVEPHSIRWAEFEPALDGYARHWIELPEEARVKSIDIADAMLKDGWDLPSWVQ